MGLLEIVSYINKWSFRRGEKRGQKKQWLKIFLNSMEDTNPQIQEASANSKQE